MYVVTKSKKSSEAIQKYKPTKLCFGIEGMHESVTYKNEYLKSEQSNKLSSRIFGPFFEKKLIGRMPF